MNKEIIIAELVKQGSSLIGMVIRDNMFKGKKEAPEVKLLNSPPAETPAALPEGKVPINPKTCLPCSTDHLSTVCGALGEAVRFARREGMKNEDVQKRIAMGQDEINIMERIDLHPTAFEQLPEKEKGVARWVLGETKKLRDELKKQDLTVDELEKLSADACRLRLDLRIKSMGLPPQVADIAAKMEKGELTKDQAKEQIKAIMQPKEGG